MLFLDIKKNFKSQTIKSKEFLKIISEFEWL